MTFCLTRKLLKDNGLGAEYVLHSLLQFLIMIFNIFFLNFQFRIDFMTNTQNFMSQGLNTVSLIYHYL